LNLEAFPREFADFNLKAYLKETLPNWCELTIINDAIGQLLGGILFLEKDHNMDFRGQKIAYIGPGTGLGGCFCFVDQQGHPHIKTDGHISDIRMISENGNEERAEDLFSGTAFEKLTGLSGKTINENADLIAKYQKDILQMGYYLAKIIGAITLGQFAKMNETNNWNQTDLDFVKGMKIFLLGGSLGTKGHIGALVQKYALAELNKSHHKDITILPIKASGNAALIGLASLI